MLFNSENFRQFCLLLLSDHVIVNVEGYTDQAECCGCHLVQFVKCYCVEIRSGVSNSIRMVEKE